MPASCWNLLGEGGRIWGTGVNLQWLICMQVGFGLYPVVVKEFAAKQEANPVILSFYRQVLVMVKTPGASTAKSHQFPVEWFCLLISPPTYRDICCFPVLFLCAIVAERKVLIPSLKMLIVSPSWYFSSQTIHLPAEGAGQAGKHQHQEWWITQP